MKLKKIKITKIILVIAMAILIVFSLLSRNQTDWGNGGKIHLTNGVIKERYVDKERGIFTQVLFKIDNEIYTRWFLTDIKNDPIVYYIEGKGDEFIRLTDPIDNTYSNISIIIAFALFIIFLKLPKLHPKR